MLDATKTIPFGHVVSTSLPYEAAVVRITSLLKDEGFGIISDIDIAKTMHEKIGKVFRPYRILGACNPTLAHDALSKNSQLGLLLPCNVVVQSEGDSTIVSAVDTRSLLSVMSDPSLLPMADEVNARLLRVLNKIAEL
ncbi:MAG: DUF302 domain-containing protein [Candidatus Eremiobacteraeota bacterium]|nr:DUF302 domain-containing protein [Candidatus Eremiobacteraeota bacterium]